MLKSKPRPQYTALVYNGSTRFAPQISDRSRLIPELETTPLPPVALLVATLKEGGVVLPPGPVRVDAYGDSEALSAELLELVRSGKKRAGTGLLWAYEAEAEPLPRQGDIEIVVNHQNEPALVTRLTSVEIMPYSEVSAEYAAIEGEGDGSLQYWRSAHWSFFSRECHRLGREPQQNMPVVCSVFEVLNVIRQRSGV